MQRFENQVHGSPITAVTVARGEGIGRFGPVIVVEMGTDRRATCQYRLYQVVSFLNINTGKLKLDEPIFNRTISREVEDAVVVEFEGILVLSNSRYEYIGPGVSMEERIWIDKREPCL